MLIKRRCTATGIINFYSKNEPYIAVGSVISRSNGPAYVWRYYGEDRACGGTACDMKAVERVMVEQHRRSTIANQEGRCAA